MTQTVILKKLAKYLLPLNPELSEQLEAKDEKTQQPEVKGHCFGFAVVDAVMALPEVDRQQWWNENLVTITSADETKLDKSVSLTGAAPVPLNMLYDRTVNYVVFNHGMTELLEGQWQDNILDPVKGGFEIVDKNGQIRKIKKRTVIAGNFTGAELKSFFDANQLSGTICLIHNANHTINVRPSDAPWEVYNSNYPHDSLAAMHKKCDSRKALVEEITTILGKAVCVEVASIDEHKKLEFPAYERLIQSKPLELLKEDGFYMMVRHTPERIGDVLSLVEKEEETPSVLAKEISKQNSGETGLYLIVNNASSSLPKVLVLLEQAREQGYEAVASALTCSSTIKQFSYSLIYTLTLNAPDKIPKVLELAEKANQGSKIIAEAMTRQVGKEKETEFYRILKHAPAALPKVFANLEKAKEDGADAMVTVLEATCKEGVNGLKRVAKLAPASMPRVLIIAAKAIQGPTFLVKVLTRQYKPDDAVWALINNFTIQQRNSILHAFAGNLNKFDILSLINATKKIKQALATRDAFGRTQLLENMLRSLKVKINHELKQNSRLTQETKRELRGLIQARTCYSNLFKSNPAIQHKRILAETQKKYGR